MKVTLNWLKQYVDFDWSPEQLAERLKMLGPEVEPRFAATEWCRRTTRGSRRRLFSCVAPRLLVALLALLSFILPPQTHAAGLKTKNVFLIISDGFRWQEVFGGAEEQLVTRTNGGVEDVKALRKDFWRDTPEARREALLPFIWSEVKKQGQLFGNQSKGSVASVTNGKKFSFPGYNEILSGAPDPRINSNDNNPNPNVTVFEWLNGRAGLHNHVAVFGSWEAFPFIFNVERSRLPIWPAWRPRFASFAITPPEYVSGMLRDTTPMWDNLTYDSFLFHAAVDYVKRKQPRLVFVGFGETDEWAHKGRYDLYLTAAHHADDFIRRLWETAQSLRQYRGKTTFIITADHGRGSGATDWKNHGENTAGAEGDWIAVIGPDTPPLGERTNCAPVTLNQIAATIAALLGEDYHAAFPQAGAPVADILGGGK